MLLPISSFREYKKNHPAAVFSDFREERERVLNIIEEVRRNGDRALFRYTLEFDRAELESLQVPAADLARAAESIQPELLEAIRGAGANIEKFHRLQVGKDIWDREEGRLTGRRLIPLQSVGAYIPGGTAAYPSSVLMTVIPARIAGVKEINICTPPDSSGLVDPITLAAAHEAGATAVYRVGGAQAIAAMAYGTETVPAVQKIVGPGNIYVTLAKKEVFGQVGIDMLAGPSEIVIVADDRADPAYIAADLLSQAEHDPLSRPILVTCSEKLAFTVGERLEDQLATLPRREIAEQSLREQGAAILVSGLEEAWPVVNELAPEHLELHLENAQNYIDLITCAGTIFIGPYSPEPLGDYWAGLNHVLPTSTAARFASALGVDDFVKRSQVLSYSSEALDRSLSQIAALARAEGLEAHARAVLIRRQINEPSGKS